MKKFSKFIKDATNENIEKTNRDILITNNNGNPFNNDNDLINTL